MRISQLVLNNILNNVFHVYQSLLSIMAKENNYLPNKLLSRNFKRTKISSR